VGEDGFFRFGLDSTQVHQTLAQGYRPWERLEQDSQLASALSLIEQGHFSSGDRDIFQPLVSNLRHCDPYLVLADFSDYRQAQERVDTVYRQSDEWQRRSILTTARMGQFSSDRAIRSYGCEIWGCCPLPVHLTPH
jgi:starch phosphorylase